MRTVQKISSLKNVCWYYYFLCSLSSILALAIYLLKSVLVNMYKSTAHIIFIGYSNKFFPALYPHKSSLLLSNNSYRKLRKLKYLWFPILLLLGKEKDKCDKMQCGGADW